MHLQCVCCCLQLLLSVPAVCVDLEVQRREIHVVAGQLGHLTGGEIDVIATVKQGKRLTGNVARKRAKVAELLGIAAPTNNGVAQ